MKPSLSKDIRTALIGFTTANAPKIRIRPDELF
jgi:hypothetical protein